MRQAQPGERPAQPPALVCRVHPDDVHLANRPGFPHFVCQIAGETPRGGVSPRSDRRGRGSGVAGRPWSSGRRRPGRSRRPRRGGTPRGRTTAAPSARAGPRRVSRPCSGWPREGGGVEPHPGLVVRPGSKARTEKPSGRTGSAASSAVRGRAIRYRLRVISSPADRASASAGGQQPVRPDAARALGEHRVEQRPPVPAAAGGLGRRRARPPASGAARTGDLRVAHEGAVPGIPEEVDDAVASRRRRRGGRPRRRPRRRRPPAARDQRSRRCCAWAGSTSRTRAVAPPPQDSISEKESATSGTKR